jgi:general secretion pathway protein B
MSYILEALKKSERERKRDTIPGILSVHDGVLHETRKRNIWPYILVAALLLNAGIIIWWLGSGHPKKTTAPAQIAQQPGIETRTSLAEQMGHQDPSAVRMTSDTQQNTKVQGTVQKEKSQSLVHGEPVGTMSRTNSPQKGRLVEPKAGEPPMMSVHQTTSRDVSGTSVSSSAPLQGDALSKRDAEQRIFQLKELPSSVRQNLPDFSISVHIHAANPESRMVRINDHTLREGQELSGGIRLEEITHDGVILNYQKYRFHVGLK